MTPLKIIGSKEDTLLYPDTDGEPIAENTIQYEWITMIRGNLDILYANAPDVFVAADLFWYPVEGNPKIRVAPDVMLAFGRPKGHRYSYLQWKEEGVTPQVVFEIQSPSNRAQELEDKFRFYERHGVEEYYLFDPDTGSLDGWHRVGGSLADILQMNGWVSPRLGIVFDLSSGKLVLKHPSGERFRGMLELSDLRQEAEKDARKAKREARKAEKEARKAGEDARKAGEDARKAGEEARKAGEEARKAGEDARKAVEDARKAEEALKQTREALEEADRRRAVEANRAEKLAAQLRALGIDPEG